MSDYNKPIDRLLYELKERAKELNCLYEVQELLSMPGVSIHEICQSVVEVLPPGWQYPEICQANITLGGRTYETPGFVETSWVQSAEIVVQEEPIGRVSVYYTVEKPGEDEGPFLKEERKLIDTIAEQLGHYILHKQLREVFEEQRKSEQERRAEWWVILTLLKRTDPKLLMQISRKMINYLYWNSVSEAERLMEYFSPAHRGEAGLSDENRPFQIASSSDALAISNDVFELASKHLSDEDILESIQRWIREEQSGFLVTVMVNPSSTLAEICTAIERYRHGMPELSKAREQSVLVSLIRRLLSDEPEYLDAAKDYIGLDDFVELTERIIYPGDSHGKLGGKGSGLFLAMSILREAGQENELLQQIRTPKTWYIASDNIFHFMSYNNLEDIVEQKYKDIDQVRQEYPYVSHVFKTSLLPPEIIRGLSLALDYFGDVPLIVRSSSLLEDHSGSAFAGKYKSLFIANMGTKEERLIALIDAITEVYASMFGPDPIRYRIEHGLVDKHEEMGIMIQEVVGTAVGHYYFPSYAGVAFSHNEIRWSSRIRQEDGVIRVVPGLGTRAVDRLSDDYPILISPGQPGLRVNVTYDEIIRYAPKKIDVINLKTGSFETVDIQALLKELGDGYPGIQRLISIITDGKIQTPIGLGIDFEGEDYVVTFEGLISHTQFVKQTDMVLDILQEKLGHPVDIEFAYDGANFYLLQCRSQSYGEDSLPAKIPDDLAEDQLLFSASKYISNGTVSNVKYIVYVDPGKYAELSSYQDYLDVARAVGRLNQLLPKGQFILMGPGRWGSRGDVKLGVNVTYSDINNTAMLIEIARKREGYVPEPSFGTHFFQDLVEASIRYLPLYPDDRKAAFNEEFFKKTANHLVDFAPEFSQLEEVVRVIDVPGSTSGCELLVLMNAEIEKAVAILRTPEPGVPS